MRGKEYTAYTVITTLITAAIFACIILFVLPSVGITIPLWGIFLLIVAFGIYNFVTYRACKAVLCQESQSPTQLMVGKKGHARTNLYPSGIIWINGELWKAQARYNIDKEETVEVEGIEGLTLFVTRPLNNKQ